MQNLNKEKLVSKNWNSSWIIDNNTGGYVFINIRLESQIAIDE